MNIQQVLHPIHDASKVLPEMNDDVLVYFRTFSGDPIIGHRGYFSQEYKDWNIADDECDAYDGEKYRKIFETPVAWSKLPEITISE